MATSSRDAVLERTKVREVAGVFRSHEALETAVDDLLLAGFERADIDVVAGPDELRERLGAPFLAAEELADIPEAPRHPVIKRDDTAAATVVAVSTLASAGALLSALVIVLSGGTFG